MIQVLWIVVFQLFFLFSAHSKDVFLFDMNGNQVPNYNGIVSELEEGDRLIFYDHVPHHSPTRVTYTLGPRRGSGNTTVIFSIGNGDAIRLPLGGGIFAKRSKGSLHFISFIDFYLETYKKLKDTGIPLVPVNLEKSRRSRYLIVADMKENFLLSTLLKDRGVSLGLSSSEYKKVIEDLFHFARKSYKVMHIEDLRPEQIGYVNGKWVLYDYTNAKIITRDKNFSFSMETIFDGGPSGHPTVKYFGDYPELQSLLANAVREERVLKDSANTSSKLRISTMISETLTESNLPCPRSDEILTQVLIRRPHR